MPGWVRDDWIAVLVATILVLDVKDRVMVVTFRVSHGVRTLTSGRDWRDFPELPVAMMKGNGCRCVFRITVGRLFFRGVTPDPVWYALTGLRHPKEMFVPSDLRMRLLPIAALSRATLKAMRGASALTGSSVDLPQNNQITGRGKIFSRYVSR